MRNLLSVSRIAMHPPAVKTSSSKIPTQTYEDVLVVGDRALISLLKIAPSGAISVRIDVKGKVELSSLESGESFPTGVFLTLNKAPVSVAIAAQKPSKTLNDRSIDISFAGNKDKILVTYKLRLSVLRICLDVDADRDGIVEEDSPHKSSWKWGSDGYGAIILVNNDRDGAKRGRRDRLDKRINGPLDLQDLSPMVVRKVGPEVLPPGCELRLLVTDAASERIRIFDKLALGGRQLIAPKVPQATLPDIREEIVLGVEGLDYPDREFTGLVTINLILVRNEEQLYSQSVVFRVAPWIMTPNTLSPLQVFVSRLDGSENQEFIENLSKIAESAGVELIAVQSSLHQGDRWMQDEIEIGYSQAPGIEIPVVLDSPRDRGLDDFPEKGLLGPDFGYVTRSKGDRNSLDSFGNLEVSPPVTVDGYYPLGRIIFGGALPTATAGRRVMRVVREFLYGQQVQAPIELYSDWLEVGHVDEFMTFVPATTPKGFKLLLASPDQCYSILNDLKAAGYDDALLLEGKKRYDEPAAIAVSEVLRDTTLAGHNYRYQEYINWNRTVLIRELGLSEEDIIDLPALFYPEGFGGEGASAYFPDMVNMIVLGKHLGIPKPYGPKVNGRCQFEAYVEEILGQVGLTCHFIDDYEVYHMQLGEVHCGTNTRRQPFTYKWWDTKPALSVDI